MTTAQRKAIETIKGKAVFYETATGRGVTYPGQRKAIDRRTLNVLTEQGLVRIDPLDLRIKLRSADPPFQRFLSQSS
jgi:hypothetical protein